MGMMAEHFSFLLFRTCLVGCLLGATATLYFLFGLAGQVQNLFVNLGVAAILSVAALFLLYHFFSAAWDTNWVGRVIWGAILFILVLEMVLGLLPPIARDELNHHLAMPRLYAQAGRIIEVPFAPYAYYPMLLDMLYTPWVYWGYDFVPKLIHALFGFLTGLLLYAYLARRMNGVYGLLGWFFFISTPAILRLSHWAYIDLGITFYSTASMLCLLRWREERDALKWLALAALSLGFALATKPNGLVAALLLSVLFMLAAVKPPIKSRIGLACQLLLFGALTLLPFLPWLTKNWLQTGNPFYPLLGNWFAAKTSVVTETASFGGLGIFEKRALLYGESLWQIIGLPVRLFFSGQDDKPQYFDGVLTPVLILFLPWAFKGKWLEEKKFLASYAVLFFLYALFLVDLRIRYILLIVPPLVVLLVYGIFNVYLRIKQPAVLFAGLVFFAAWHGTYLWQYLWASAPFAYLQGIESRDAYLTRMLPDYSALQYVSRTTPRTAKIYLLFIGRRAYYCDRDYFHDGGELPGFLLGAIRAAQDPAQIEQALKRENITHLLVREDLLKGFLSNNLTSEQAKLWNEFAASRLKLAFHDRGHSVFEIHG